MPQQAEERERECVCVAATMMMMMMISYHIVSYHGVTTAAQTTTTTATEHRDDTILSCAAAPHRDHDYDAPPAFLLLCHHFFHIHIHVEYRLVVLCAIISIIAMMCSMMNNTGYYDDGVRLTLLLYNSAHCWPQRTLPHKKQQHCSVVVVVVCPPHDMHNSNDVIIMLFTMI